MKRSSKTSSFLISFSFFLLLLLLQLATISNATDTISTMQIIRDGETLVSPTQSFELGFFSPGGSRNRYVGIWYKNKTPQTVVWVANREAPLRNTTSGAFTVNSQGQLIVRDDKNTVVWSTNTSREARNPVVQLLDSGNLVIREADDDDLNHLWRSFDHPTDTILPGMGLEVNLVTGKQIYLTSWKSSEDPGLGDYTISLEVTGYPQIVTKRGDVVVYRAGPWNGLRMGGWPILNPNGTYSCKETLIMNSSVVYYNRAIQWMSMFTLTPSGVGKSVSWANGLVVSYKSPGDMCDNYGTCGAHGSCNTDNLPICGCLRRFVPRDKVSWAQTDWSEGCVRPTPLNCSSTDVFFKYSGIKMPDARHTWYNENSSLKECKVLCLRNCACTAYSNLNISGGGSGCLLWFGDLVDIKQLSWKTEDIYIRMVASELDINGRKKAVFIAILTSLAGIVLLGLSFALFISKRKKNDPKQTKEEGPKEKRGDDLELPIYDMSTLSKATDKFSNNRKLGEGGFGHVYKGMLDGGKEIAVKRLSKTSSQGIKEFKNEIVCITKLQHRNLVKILGYCIEGDEKMLIYEYMPNKSLDCILFDKTKSKQFDWPKRFLVINGIARGLMYLHRDSRLRIIHRDLKASNILLDDDLNPKITDFGIARIFRGSEIEANTQRIVGTYGYMSPEYAGYGLCSLKSDVYSFGVLLLEIVSGQRSVNFHHTDNYHHLLRHAWILYKEGRSLELVDPNIVNTSHVCELEMVIHVGLLCVQQFPEDRPIMSSVVLMLGGGGVLSDAKKPGFFTNAT